MGGTRRLKSSVWETKLKLGGKKLGKGKGRQAANTCTAQGQREKSCSGWVNGLILRRADFEGGFEQTLLMQSSSDCVL